MTPPHQLIAAVVVAWSLAAAPLRAAPGERRPLRPGTHPFVDRFLLAETTRVDHVMHRPTPREAVLVMDEPWEGKMSGYGTVLRDPEGKVRLYYRGGGDLDPPEVTCVAFSNDGGVTFGRPELGLFEVRGTRRNNVVFTAPDRLSYGESHNFAPFLDVNPARPADERWKAVALRRDEDERGESQRMLTVLASPDGLRWKHLAEHPVIRSGGGFDSLNRAFFDAARGRYVCYFRVGRGGLRSFARAHSADFLRWTIDQPLEFRPPQDEQWYTNGVTPYPGAPGLYVALPMRFVPQRKTVGDPPRKTDGLSDAVLMTSRDGLAWDRTFREAFIRPGADADNWGNAHGNNTPLAGVIETGPGEWSVYWFEGGLNGPPRIRRGTLRAHGLASVHADADGGEFVTPPLQWSGQLNTATLRLNFATSAVGSVRVEVQRADGKPLDGFAMSDCTEMYGDEPLRAVRWGDGGAIPVGEPFRLRVRLQDADVYAITLE